MPVLDSGRMTDGHRPPTTCRTRIVAMGSLLQKGARRSGEGFHAVRYGGAVEPQKARGPGRVQATPFDASRMSGLPFALLSRSNRPLRIAGQHADLVRELGLGGSRKLRS